MADYILTRKAVEDLTDIWTYTLDEWSEDQADTYYRQLTDQCQNIADQPSLGRTYPEVRSDLHGVISGRHIIFYRSID